jgi:tetratricopeptide (TPR) repeat protein
VATETRSTPEPSDRAPRSSPVFVANDYAGALEQARQQELPLFVDAWAPWCHTCVSMKAFVLKDPALDPVVSKFVWASVDTEHDSSAQFVRKFPMEVWPTLWVIDPKDERPRLKWSGAATATELASLLEATVDSLQADDPNAQAAWAAWQLGNARIAKAERDLGIAEYRRALSLAPADFSGRRHVVEALVFQLGRAEQHVACLDLATREFGELPRGTARLNTVLVGLGCAGKLDQSNPRDEVLLREANRIVADPDEPVLADDRSSLYQQLVFRTEDEARATQTARRWSAFLEREAAEAASPAERVVFDYHRLLAYEASGELARSIPMLEQSEHDFPDDYNAPSRLALVQLELGRREQALAAIERALERVYGPRTLRVLRQKAEILQALGRNAEATAVLKRAVDFGERSGPLPAGYQRLLADLKDRQRRSRNSTPKP